MGYKNIAKAKIKRAHRAVAKVDKKAGYATTSKRNKISKTDTLDSKQNAVTSYSPSSAHTFHELHDAASPIEVATPPYFQSADRQSKHTELANMLVDQVAEADSDVRELCDTHGLRREELGRLTGFSLRALAEWSSGKLPSQPAKRRLREVRRLLDALAQIVKRESIRNWLHRPNKAFDRLTPLQVIEIGEIDRIWAMLHDMASGQPE
jgi:hypothetical protein